MRRKSDVWMTTRTLVVKPLTLALWPRGAVDKLTVDSRATQDLTPEMLQMNLAETPKKSKVFTCNIKCWRGFQISPENDHGYPSFLLMSYNYWLTQVFSQWEIQWPCHWESTWMLEKTVHQQSSTFRGLPLSHHKLKRMLIMSMKVLPSISMIYLEISKKQKPLAYSPGDVWRGGWHQRWREARPLAAPWGSQRHPTSLALLSGHKYIFFKCNKMQSQSLRKSICSRNNQNTSLQSQPRQVNYSMKMLRSRHFSTKKCLQRALIHRL